MKNRLSNPFIFRKTWDFYKQYSGFVDFSGFNRKCDNCVLDTNCVNCEQESKQVNVTCKRKYSYWWIEPAEKPIKLLNGEIPEILQKVGFKDILTLKECKKISNFHLQIKSKK